MEKHIAATFAVVVMVKNLRSVNSAKIFKIKNRSWIIFAIAIIGIGLFAAIALAHGEVEVVREKTLEEIIRTSTWWVVGVSSIFIGIVTLIALGAKVKHSHAKWTLFLLIVIPTIITTFYLASSTIFLNLVSVTKGPVHWHAEFRVIACGQELDLINTSGFSNSVGSPVLHEHGDNWIHVEGVPVKLEDVNLHSFFEKVGGELDDNHMIFPTDGGLVYYENNQFCEDGSQGKLQMFLYRTENGVVTQTKVENFSEYVLAPHAQVPPGDCFILEFGEVKERTDNICTQYEIAIQKGELILE